MRKFSTAALVGTATLAALFLSVRLRQDTTLENSLVDMSLIPPVPRRAVRVETGTPLEGALADRTLTLEESPYLLLSGNARIPRGVTVRAEPGVLIYAAEAARLVVEGTFIADGVSLASNQRHPLARLWHGITVRDGGRAHLTRSAVAHASAALTCAAGASLTIRDSMLAENTVGVVVLPRSRDCGVENVTVADGRIAFQLIGGSPTITNATLDRVNEGIRVFHQAAPRIRALKAKRLTGAAIRHAAVADLVVRGLSLPDGDPGTHILDGADAPTHRWHGEEFPTGNVTVH